MIKREDIQYRVGTFKSKDNKKYATFLIYVDARTVFEELDHLYKGEWSFDWSKVEGENAVKGVLTVGDRKFSDVGYPNDSKVDMEGETRGEWLKDAVSDSVKRCAVQLGIGRFLYDAPLLYTEDVETYTDKNGYEKFSKLGRIGKQEIEGRIDQWYDKLSINEL